jgi:hypothetical protein
LSTVSTSQESAASTGDLSAGAKAGIGVGVALGVLGICCLLGAIFIMRRHRRKHLNSDGPSDNSAPKSTWQGSPVRSGPKHEMGLGQYDRVFEMSAT